MKHEAKSEEEIAKMGLQEPGVYDFKIVEAEEKVSPKGYDMFALKLHVYAHDGSEIIIKDWVLPAFPKKFKHMHDACGLLDLYQTGETKGSDLIGKCGKLMLGVGKPRQDQNGIERVYNQVEDYVKKENMLPSGAPAALNDEIPF